MRRPTRWLVAALLACLLSGIGVQELAGQVRQTPLLGAGGGLTELPATTCTNQFLRALATDGTGDCDAIVAADLPASVVLTSGSYADPAWLTSLAYSKLTGTPQALTSSDSPSFAGLTLTGGSPGDGKLWTSDGSGVGSWEDAPESGGPGTGSLNTLAFWNTTSTLGSSLLTTDGSNITLSSGIFIGPALKLTGGSPGAGKVLTSDADGDATWQTASVPASEALIPPTTNTSDLGSSSNRFKKSYLTAGLDIAQGTITANDPAWSSTATWNSSGTTFTHLKANITDTASAAASLLLDLQVGASSKFSVTKAGTTTLGGGQLLTGDGTVALPAHSFSAHPTWGWYWSSGLRLSANNTAALEVLSNAVMLTSGFTFGWGSLGSGGDVVFSREAASILALSGSSASSLRVYGTALSGSNYVRASLGSSSTLVTLAAETAGTGADNVNLQLTPAGSGTVVMPTVKLTGGTPGSGKVLTSDADGDGTWEAAAGVLVWTEVTGTTQQMASKNGYIANNASLVTLTLPTTAAVGDVIEVVGKGAGGWSIAQNASQQIHWRGSSSTVGTGGSVSSTTPFDMITLRCVTANLVWVAL